MHLMDVLDACYETYGKDFEFNFISSWFVYGNSKDREVDNSPIDEDAPCNPTGFYSITKRCAEQLLISYCKTFGIKYKILRLANVLGHEDKGVSKKKNALQYLMDKIVHNEPIELYSGGRLYRDYIDVRDCVNAIKLVMENGEDSSIYNISNGKSHLFRDLINYSIRHSESKSNILEILPTEFHSTVQATDVFLSNEKLKKLGYSPKFTIEETLENIIDNYKQ